MDELSDDDIQQLMDLGIIPDKQDILLDQIKQAQALRYGKGPGMRGDGGRVQTAANPLEFLAYGLQGRQAAKDLKDLRDQQQELLRKQSAGRKDYFTKLYPKAKPVQPLTPMDLEGGYE